MSDNGDVDIAEEPNALALEPPVALEPDAPTVDLENLPPREPSAAVVADESQMQSLQPASSRQPSLAGKQPSISSRQPSIAGSRAGNDSRKASMAGEKPVTPTPPPEAPAHQPFHSGSAHSSRRGTPQAAASPAPPAPPPQIITKPSGALENKPSIITKTSTAQPGSEPPKSRIPAASPGRVRKASPGRSRIPVQQQPEESPISTRSQSRSPGRSISPGSGGGWNMYNKETVKPRAQVTISGPSEEEREKRRQWAREKRRKDKLKAQLEGENTKEEIARKKAEEEVKLEARRAAIRERIARQHEIAARMASERAAAEERAKAEAGKFKGKPLYEKLMEDYEQQKEREDAEKKKQYEEEVAAMKHVRPHQIIAGEVVVKPPPKPEPSPVKERPAPPRAPGRGHALDGYNVRRSGGFEPDELGIGGLASPPQVKPQDKPRKQGMVLYSTRQKQDRFVERAVSPFVFNAEQQPVNVPEQSQFWSKAKPQVLNVDAPHLAAVQEDGDAPQMSSPTEKAAEEHVDLGGVSMMDEEFANMEVEHEQARGASPAAGAPPEGGDEGEVGGSGEGAEAEAEAAPEDAAEAAPEDAPEPGPEDAPEAAPEEEAQPAEEEPAGVNEGEEEAAAAAPVDAGDEGGADQAEGGGEEAAVEVEAEPQVEAPEQEEEGGGGEAAGQDGDE